ncbi:HTH-type transcriptional activator AllS [Thalassovita gelatinovora]|uniref:HTH-type transcriptional activator AllS n=1 Tax=Thalassovita gelatinovora TaxID=53501 RepID=A0A0P1FE55_THAGE|nr:LysR family transcriptional regulator [Thalassovita gelatinovora]QIZ81502.1 LysR family transcriptional regulator [Thalassovita gelatinovora]CUH66358.1 HTH-type transcriptional activator AllS [Thalassovita gelatinovora]SEQ24526.1 regulatory helix-turn-helix protein, lysR family [Thalassovita gelatinovora]
MAEQKNHPLLFELLRSFTALAETLNLSRTVERMNSTRQTVRRHINILEELMGEQLFVMVDRQYQLTDAGRRCLREAEDIQARGVAWLNGEAGHIGGLFHIAKEEPGGWCYYLQQHPISEIWTGKTELLKQGIKCWSAAEGRIADKAFDPIRDNLMVFRKTAEDWICTAVGSQSSYATWYGWRWESSSIGRAVPALPGGAAHAVQLSQPFEDIRATRGLRYDHVHTYMNRGEDSVPEPISFKRLLLGCRYPDDSFAMASMVVRSYDLQIEGLSQDRIETMPENQVMEDYFTGDRQ